MTETGLFMAQVGRDDLADALRGKRPATTAPFRKQLLPKFGGRDALVLWPGASHRPCMICIAETEQQELFNWATTFQSDLSPITSWCHVLSLKELDRITEAGRSEADLFGLEAAWAGAAVAEAMILSRRNFDAISLPTCLATDTFAIARTLALYGTKTTIADTIERVDAARDRLRRPAERWRPTSSLAIASLLRVLPNAPAPPSQLVDLLSRACRSLHSQSGLDDQRITPDILREMAEQVPRLSSLEQLHEISAEDRVKLLREIRTWAASAQDDSQNLLFFAAGYVMSRIGGAERDLRLAEDFKDAYANVLTWATILGGLGAETYWVDAFGGIGRLVARELSRSLDASEPPTADISADELMVVTSQDGKPSKFRTAQRNFATVSVRPGVVVQLGIAEDERSAKTNGDTRTTTQRSSSGDELNDRHLEALAERLFPYLRTLLLRAGFGQSSKDKRPLGKNKAPQLPLKEK